MNDHQERHAKFEAAYTGDASPPWNSGLVPPEVIAMVQGDRALPPGRAVDVGCGTGINAVYLAKHGWQVLGLDWVDRAVEQARQRADAAKLSAGQVRFMQGDIGHADVFAGCEPVDFWLDMGCLHGLVNDVRQQYAIHAAKLTLPGGRLMLYAWREHERDGRMMGISPADVAALFAPYFVVDQTVLSVDEAGEVRPTAWYWLRRQTRLMSD